MYQITEPKCKAYILIEHVVHQLHEQQEMHKVQEVHKVHVVMSLISMKGQMRFFKQQRLYWQVCRH